MNIAILLGSPEISGGTYVIFEHATRLAQRGLPVTIITEEPVTSDRYAWHPAAGGLCWRTYGEVADELFDLAIATWWQSLYRLFSIRSRKYTYFVQSIESRFFPPRDAEIFAQRDIDIYAGWCEDTYALHLPAITEARWIQQYLAEQYNRPSMLVRNGIRKDIYHRDGAAVALRQPGRLRVLVEGPLGVFYKNVEKTIELCRQAGVEEIWLLTSSAVAEYPGVQRCFSRVPILETAAIYRSCDLLVKLSYIEGMFGPPLEMFHCGGTALVYDVTGHDEYIRHLDNSIVVKRDQEKDVVRWLSRLRAEPALLDTLKKGAETTAASWPDWDAATDQFQEALNKIDREQPDMSTICLERHATRSVTVRDGLLQARAMHRLAEREGEGGSSSPFANHIQVYWAAGGGIEPELTDRYFSGEWCHCQVVVPAMQPVNFLRVDPSVRMGVVAVRSLRVSGVDSKTIYGQWPSADGWANIAVGGTARLLQDRPDLLLLAYGEDPQLALPPLPQSAGGEWLLIEVELRETSFTKALGGNPIEVGGGAGLGFVQRLRNGFKRLTGRHG